MGLMRALLFLLLLISTASAQNTKAQMTTEINTNFPDNTTGLITPSITRTTTNDMNNSWQQGAQIRSVLGTSDTLVLADYGHVVTYNNANPIAVSLAQAIGNFTTYNVFIKNIGAGTVTITPTTSTINGTATLVIAQNQGAWIISDGTNYQLGPPGVISLTTPCVSIANYGGAGDNTTNNVTALNNALAALTAPGGCISFSGGKFKFNSGVSFNIPAGIFSVTIVGAGQDATILTWPNAAGGVTFNYTGLNSSVHVRDLSLTTGTTTGGSAINLQNATSNANPANTAVSDIYRVTMRGDDGYEATDYWTNGVNVGNVSNIQFEDVTVVGPSTANGNGINLIGLPGSSTFGVVYNIAKSTFNNLTAGITYGSFIQGVTCDQCNFTSSAGTSNGIIVPAAQTGTLAQLSVTNSQFNVPTNAIVLNSVLNNVTLSNNFVISRANSNAFNLANVTSYTVTGNNLTASSTTGTNGVVIGGSSTLGTISANAINGYTTGILLQANAATTVVSGNMLTGNTVSINNSSNAATNTGLDLPSIPFTPAYTCGTATFTNNSSKFKQEGKQTWIQVDVTFTALGTCTNVLTFTVPNTASTNADVVGQEDVNGVNPRDTVVCKVGAGTTTATCVKQGAHNYGATDHFVASGIYENP